MPPSATSATEVASGDEHRFLTPAEAAHQFDITEAELTLLRRTGQGPDWITINRTIRYSLADLKWWHAHRKMSCQ